MSPHSPEPATDRLASLVRSIKLPQRLTELLVAEPADPSPGQIWRLRWGGDVELALVTQVADQEEVRVLPVQIDEDDIDERSVVLAATQTSLEVPVAVWIDLEAGVPMHVLDRAIADVRTAVGSGDWLLDVLSAGAHRDKRPLGPYDPALIVRAQLQDRFRRLTAAAWAPSGSGDLASLLADSQIDPVRLSGLLGVPIQQALATCRGQRPLSAGEACALERELGLDAKYLLEANPTPPTDLVRALSRPRRRAQVAQLAARLDIDELTAWVRAAFGIASHAYRQTGPARGDAWDERIDRYFQASLEQP